MNTMGVMEADEQTRAKVRFCAASWEILGSFWVPSGQLLGSFPCLKSKKTRMNTMGYVRVMEADEQTRAKVKRN
jgi:hypothetical protein